MKWRTPSPRPDVDSDTPTHRPRAGVQLLVLGMDPRGFVGATGGRPARLSACSWLSPRAPPAAVVCWDFCACLMDRDALRPGASTGDNGCPWCCRALGDGDGSGEGRVCRRTADCGSDNGASFATLLPLRMVLVESAGGAGSDCQGICSDHSDALNT